MDSKSFVIWLKGFAKAANSYNITPAQWEKIIETLKTVEEETKNCTCSGKTYTYPYQGFTGTGEYITNDASKQILND